MNKYNLDDFCAKYLVIPYENKVRYMGIVSRDLRDPYAPFRVEIYSWKIKLFKCNAYIPFRYGTHKVKLIKI